MASLITVASPLLTEVGAVALTPAQRAAVWEIAAVLDERRVPAPADPTTGDAVWIEVAAARLRGAWGRDDNVWLRELLRRLEGVRFGGKAGSDAWGGVLLAQWKITDGGRVVRLLLPPAGLAALRAPETFAKIDAEAAHRLPPHARTLYGLLADKQRQRVKRWPVELAELKALLGVAGRYDGRFDDFRRRVLEPSTAAINDFGVIRLSYEVERMGRRVDGVVFTWEAKGLDEAAETARENGRHSAARGKCAPREPDAPPLVVTDRAVRFLAAAPVPVRVHWRAQAAERGYAETPADLSPEHVGRWAPWIAADLEAEGLLEVTPPSPSPRTRRPGARASR